MSEQRVRIGTKLYRAFVDPARTTSVRIDRKHLFLPAEPGIGWFRLFGRGLAWKDTRRHRLLFSERNGYVRHLMVGPWSITWLGKSGGKGR